MELYNAIGNSHYSNPEELEIVTLEDAIYLSMKNDLSFIISSVLNLYEHQSTINPNMPLRGFFYFAKQYQGIVSSNQNALYSSRLVRIPTPRYIVFYNGEDSQSDRQTLKLSDAFIRQDVASCLECTAEVLNINYNHNKKLLDACKTLHDYAILVEKVRINHITPMPLNEAIDLAVSQCIQEDVLRGFLQKHQAEVTDMILTQYDEEAFIKYEKGISFEDGEIAGYEKCRAELQPIIQQQDSKIQQQSQTIETLNTQLQQLQLQLEQLTK